MEKKNKQKNGDGNVKGGNGNLVERYTGQLGNKQVSRISEGL